MADGEPGPGRGTGPIRTARRRDRLVAWFLGALSTLVLIAFVIGRAIGML